jgi:hypothetical protein
LIEGLILLTELLVFALLLVAVKKATSPGARQSLGLFAFKADVDEPGDSDGKLKRRGDHA